MKKGNRGGADAADLDDLIEEITVDANGEGEQLWAFRQAFEDDLAAPCRRSDGTKYVVAASDVVISPTAPGGRYIAAYRKWMGLAPFPPGAPGKARRQPAAVPDLDLKGPVELVVLSVKQKAARCRLLGGQGTFTFRAGRLWDLVPGEIAVVRPAKRWTYAGNPYLSGTIESTRLDARALGLDPLRLE